MVLLFLSCFLLYTRTFSGRQRENAFFLSFVSRWKRKRLLPVRPDDFERKRRLVLTVRRYSSFAVNRNDSLIFSRFLLILSPLENTLKKYIFAFVSLIAFCIFNERERREYTKT